jgi:hypothetical protein
MRKNVGGRLGIRLPARTAIAGAAARRGVRGVRRIFVRQLAEKNGVL